MLQLSRAKPGNPASNYINDRVPVFSGSFFVENALYHDHETTQLSPYLYTAQLHYQSEEMYWVSHTHASQYVTFANYCQIIHS